MSLLTIAQYNISFSLQEKTIYIIYGVSGMQFQLLTFCWHSRCANVMSWHYWTILVGRWPGTYFWDIALKNTFFCYEYSSKNVCKMKLWTIVTNNRNQRFPFCGQLQVWGDRGSIIVREKSSGHKLWVLLWTTWIYHCYIQLEHNGK